MKKLIILLFITISTLLHAQFVPGDAVRIENSKKNMGFVVENQGARIGSGVCWELAFEVIKQGHPKNYEYVFDNREKFEIKETDKVIPGDIVVFLKVDRENRSFISGHVGVVSSWIEDGKFLYADQNHSFEGVKMIETYASDGNQYSVVEDSKIGAWRFDLNSVKSGSVKFYRF